MSAAVFEPQTFQTYGPACAGFSQKYIRQTKGRWAGKPLIYEAWQRGFVNELLLADQYGKRTYQEALLGISRKNGKSTMAASLALYMLMGTREQGPEVYAAAASKDQARIVFNQAKEFVEASPYLRDWLRPQRNQIICKQNGGVFRVLSSDAPLQYGLNPSGVVIDELFAHKNDELYYALTTGQLAREDPLVISITTAGWDRDSILYRLYERGMDLKANGGIERMRSEGFLFKWYQAPEDRDWRDSSVMKLANPSPWITLDLLQREARRLPESVFRRLHLNQWTESEEAWIKPHLLDACRGRPIIDLSKPIVAMAIDVATKRDSTAIVWGQWHGDKLHVGQVILLPEEQRPGFQISDVRARLSTEASHFQRVQEIAFDPWQFRESAELLMNDERLPMVEFPQINSRMAPASETLYELILNERIVWDGDPEFRKQILSAVVRHTERGGWRIDKNRSADRIDACVALAMMADRAVTLRTVKPSVYERRGILTIPRPNYRTGGPDKVWNPQTGQWEAAA